jgi:phosphatidylglycerophosphate synthase
VRAVQTGPLAGLVGQLALLVALAQTVGLSSMGWLVGVSYGVATTLILAAALDSHGVDALSLPNRVTLVRATLVGGVAALVANSFSRPVPLATLVALSLTALILDAVDGWVARRTGSVSSLGARFDMEVDAFLILVLSGYVARSIGVWVLAIGLARYAFGAAGWLAPWLREPLPPRYWRKVVAATQGIVLTLAAAEVVPQWLAEAALAGALVMLAESFGRDVRCLWRGRVEPRPLVVAARSGRADQVGRAVDVVPDLAAAVPSCGPGVVLGTAPEPAGP